MPPKAPRISRRALLRGGFYAAPALCAAEAFWFELEWLRVRRLRLTQGRPRLRLVHFTDLHHKGDTAYLNRVVDWINRLSPDVACFTGDLVEEWKHLAGVLEGLRRVSCPLYGVPGNHDHWSGAPFDQIAKVFTATGGGWLVDETVRLPGTGWHLTGLDDIAHQPRQPRSGRSLLLMHYPAWVDQLALRHDLILAGHSHGGQVRLPFLGAMVLPGKVGHYDRGLFQTPAGPLYVNPGIGWFHLAARFLCRPEVTLLEL